MIGTGKFGTVYEGINVDTGALLSIGRLEAVDSTAACAWGRKVLIPGETVHERTFASRIGPAFVKLIVALSWVIGYVGRVHHDRARFSIPKDVETDLYVACVDGVIMDLEKDKCNAFMEVKRDLRADNSSVRRQIAAQMAAFT